MSSARHLSLLCVVLAGTFAWPAAAQSPERLGRLFLSPQQRDELDRRRQLNIKDVVVQHEGSVTVDGRVTRSSGKTTTWLNGVPEHDAHRSRDASRVSVHVNESRGSVPLKVGETVDRAQGTVEDGLQGGRVTVNRPGQRR